MPVEFLTDEQVAGYAAFGRAPSRAELERFFFLDDVDRELVESKRRPHNRIGFAVLLTSVRYLGVFLDDPVDVPTVVVDYLAEQLGIDDASVLKAYGERENTRLEHVRELRRVLDYREFAEVEDELRTWVDARAWTTGEGPKALFDASVGWLRERRVLLPGVTTLTRPVASVREVANQRMWDSLYGLLDPGQRAMLDALLVVPDGARVSELDRLRRGPVRVSGPQMSRALERAAEIAALGVGEVDVSGVPPRRLAELSRYGVDGKASLLRRHGASRRQATLLATAVYLTTRAVDDALDLLEMLISTKLLARAERETAKAKMKTLPKVERASAKLAAAMQVLLETTTEQVDTGTGEVFPPAADTVEAVWERIEAVVPRRELAAAIAAITELAPPLDSDADQAWRAQLVTRFPTVRPFLVRLTTVVDFGATPEGAPVLAALRTLPGLMGRKKVAPDEIDVHLLAGSWRRLVLAAPHLEPGTVDWKAYTFCVLEQFHRMLRHRQIFAKNSSKWGDPRAKLLDGPVWEQVKATVLASLSLPATPGEQLAARAELLDATYRQVAAALPRNTQVVFDDAGRLHLAALEPEAEPASLVKLREAVNAMLPRVDLPEILLEVFSWTGADQAFTSITGGEARLADLHVTIAALLVAHGCNVGYTPVIGGIDALKYDRLSHVDQTYLRLATYRAANATSRRHLAEPAQRPSRRPRREGRGRHPARLPVRPGRAVRPRRRPPAGNDRDRHRLLQRHRLRPAHPRRLHLRPAAGRPAGPEDVAHRSARGLRDLHRRRPRPHRHEADRAALGGHPADHRLHPHRRRPRPRRHPHAVPRRPPTPLGDAIAHYGRISKTLHILRLADEPDYRHQIKAQANLQEGRHALARKIFHGKNGQLYQNYQEGMEDQIGALGLVLNALVLFNTRYMDAALTQLRADGFAVRDEDVARLSPFVRHHINVLGRYSFQLPDLPGGLRPLRDKHATDDG